MKVPSQSKKAILNWLKRAMITFVGLVLVLTLFILGLFYLRKDIIQSQLLKTVNNLQQGELVFEELSLSPLSHLPDLAIGLDNIRFYELPAGQRSPEARPILTLEHLYIALNIWDLIRKQVNVEELSMVDGRLKLIVNEDNVLNLENALQQIPKESISMSSMSGFANMTIGREANDSLPDWRLNRIEISNLAVQFVHRNTSLVSESVIHQMAASFQYKEPVNDIRLSGTLESKYLKSGNRKFIRNKKIDLDLAFQLNEATQIASIQKGEVQYDRLKASLDGHFNVANGKEMDLRFDASDQDLTLLSYLLEDDILAFNPDFLTKGDIELQGTIKGISSSRLPIGDISFKAKDINLNIPGGEETIEDLDMVGYFSTGLAPDLSEGVLHLEKLSASLPGGSIKGEALWVDLLRPNLSASFDLNAEISGYEKIFKLHPLDSLSGRIHLRGEVSSQFDFQRDTILKALNNLQLDVDKVAFSLPGLDRRVENLDGKLSMQESQLVVEQLRATYGESNLQLHGVIDKVLHYVFNWPAELEADLSITSDGLLLSETPLAVVLPDFLQGQTVEELNTKVEIKTSVSELTEKQGPPNLAINFGETKLVFDALPDIHAQRASLGIRSDTAGRVTILLNKLEGKSESTENGTVHIENGSLKVDSKIVAITADVSLQNLSPAAFMRQLNIGELETAAALFDGQANPSLSGNGAFTMRYSLGKRSLQPLILNDLSLAYHDQASNQITIQGADLSIDTLRVGKASASLSWLPDVVGHLVSKRVILDTQGGIIILDGWETHLDKKLVRLATKIEMQDLQPHELLSRLPWWQPDSLPAYFRQDNSQLLNGQMTVRARYELSRRTVAPLTISNLNLDYRYQDSLFLELEKSSLQLKRLSLTDEKARVMIPGVANLIGQVHVAKIRSRTLSDLGFSCRMEGSQNKVKASFTINEDKLINENGEINLDYSGAIPVYTIKYHLDHFPIETMLDKFYEEQLMAGNVDVDLAISTKGEKTEELIRNAFGSVSIEGKDLVLYGMDLDELLQKYERNQRFKLVDVSAYFLAGPLGTTVTKGMDFVDVLQLSHASDASTPIPELMSMWRIKEGHLMATDVGFATDLNRVVLDAEINVPQDSIEHITVHVLDEQGCSLFSQSLWGNYDKIEIGKVNVMGNRLGAVINVLNLVAGDNCQPMYEGELQHPQDRN